MISDTSYSFQRVNFFVCFFPTNISARQRLVETNMINDLLMCNPAAQINPAFLNIAQLAFLLNQLEI